MSRLSDHFKTSTSAREINMTRGNVWRVLFAFFFPLILGNITTVVGGMCNTMIFGRAVGNNALAATVNGGQIPNLVSVFLGGLVGGVRIFLAKAFGADDKDAFRSTVWNGGILVVGSSVLICGTCMILSAPLLRTLNHPYKIFDSCRLYFILTFANLILTNINAVITSVFSARGDAGTLFAISGITIVTTVIYQLIFVLLLKMMLFGALLGTILSTITTIVISLLLLSKKSDRLIIERRNRKIDIKLISVILSVGIPIGLQSSLCSFGGAIKQKGVNSVLSIDYINAVAAASPLTSCLLLPITGFGSAFSVFCSQNAGAGNLKRIREGFRCTLIFCIGWSLVSILISVFFSKAFGMLFTDRQDYFSVIWKYDVICMGFFPALAILNTIREMMQALGYSRVAVFGGICEFVGNTFAGLILIPRIKEIGDMLANPIAWVLSATVYTVLFFRLRAKLQIKRQKE